MTIAQLRQYRIGSFAIFDFTASFAGALLLAPFVQKYISKEQLLWSVIPTAIVVHQITGTKTPLNEMVVGENPNLLAQIVVGLMTVKAFQKSKVA